MCVPRCMYGSDSETADLNGVTVGKGLFIQPSMGAIQGTHFCIWVSGYIFLQMGSVVKMSMC